MKLSQLQEAKYANPYNVFVYAECTEEIGDRGFSDSWCSGFFGRTTAAVGDYEIPFYENPIGKEDGYVDVFSSYEEAQDYANGRVDIGAVDSDKIQSIAKYLEST